MRNNKKRPSLKSLSKDELIKIFKNLERNYYNLQEAHQRLIRYSACLRWVLKIEFKTTENYWNSYLESLFETDFEDEPEEELIPEHVRKRLPIDKKKKEIEGYS